MIDTLWPLSASTDFAFIHHFGDLHWNDEWPYQHHFQISTNILINGDECIL